MGGEILKVTTTFEIVFPIHPTSMLIIISLFNVLPSLLEYNRQCYAIPTSKIANYYPMNFVTLVYISIICPS